MILFNKLLHGKKYLIFAVYAVLKNISDQKNGIWVFACSVNIAFTYFLFFIFLNQIGEQHLLETFFLHTLNAPAEIVNLCWAPRCPG